METKRRSFKSVDEYIGSFPESVQGKLEEMRRIIRDEIPEAEEHISYRMPAYRLAENLVYFGAHTNHIGFYPTGSGVAAFKKELTGYKSSSGAVQFPLNEPLPEELIRKIVRFRVRESQRKKKGKKGG